MAVHPASQQYQYIGTIQLEWLYISKGSMDKVGYTDIYSKRMYTHVNRLCI